MSKNNSMNAILSIEEKIKKLQDEKKLLVEKQERKLGKAIVNSWGEFANDPLIFSVIESLSSEIESRILALQDSPSTGAGKQTSND